MTNKIIDEIVFQKNILAENLSEDEKKEINIYLEELFKELSPVMEVFNHLENSEEFKKSVASSFKSEIKEQKWLEKLSKTFYDQAGIQDPGSIQVE